MLERLSSVSGAAYSSTHAMGTFPGEVLTSTEVEQQAENAKRIPPKLAFLPAARALIFYKSTKGGGGGGGGGLRGGGAALGNEHACH